MWEPSQENEDSEEVSDHGRKLLHLLDKEILNS